MLRRLVFAAGLGCTVTSATLLASPARADGDGLRIQRDYETRQSECAFRWRDHHQDTHISILGCMGYDKAMPDAAKLALARGYYASY
jgi:hypothetical protein